MHLTETILLASAIAFAASVVFAFSNHIQHIAVDHMDVRAGTLVNVGTTAILLWCAAPLFLSLEPISIHAIGLFALAGLIVPSLSMTLHTLSVRMIGPGITAGLTSTSPVFATVIAVAVLGEIITGRILVGTAIVVCGIGFIAFRSRKTGATWPIWAILVPLGAALTRGLAHNIVKLGLNDLPNPMTAALISSTVSLLVLFFVHGVSRQRVPRGARGYFWFGLCGILNGIGLVSLNTALHLGDVVVVSPLIATTPAFTLLTGWLFFKREAITWSSVIAITVIFVGCLLIITR